MSQRDSLLAGRTARRCFWLRDALQAHQHDAPALAGRQRSDVCIVGGGLAGLWTALELKERQPALDVAIVEADICGGGASGRNSGMVLSQWTKIDALVALCGEHEALRLGREFAAAADRIAAYCRAEGIEVELRRDGWIWGATCRAQLESWAGIVASLARCGEKPFTTLGREEIAALSGTHSLLAGVYDERAATLHPGRLVRGLREIALRRGVRIFEHSAMTALTRGAAPVVHTRGGSIAAQRVVLAMNAWSLRFAELRSSIVVMCSDDAVSAPIPDILDRCGYRARPLLTDAQVFLGGMRTTADHRLNPGITGGTIGFGTLGARRFEGRSQREDAIRACVRRIHPALAEVPFIDSWCGPIDRTRSGLPLFGRLPGCASVVYGYGFSGNGIASTPTAGRIMASLVLDQEDQWSSCGLVRAPERWLPREPARYIGAHLVRAAIRRHDTLSVTGRSPGLLVRAFARLAPGSITTSRST